LAGERTARTNLALIGPVASKTLLRRQKRTRETAANKMPASGCPTEADKHKTGE